MAGLVAQAKAGRLPAVKIEAAHAVVFAPAQEASRLWATGRPKQRPLTYSNPLGGAACTALAALPTPREVTR